MKGIRLTPVHSKRLLTCLRLPDLPLELLSNFGNATFKEGSKRIVSGFQSFTNSTLRISPCPPINRNPRPSARTSST